MPYIKLIYKGIEVRRQYLASLFDLYPKRVAISFWKKMYPLHKFKNCTLLTDVDDETIRTEYGYDFLTMEDARKISQWEDNIHKIIDAHRKLIQAS